MEDKPDGAPQWDYTDPNSTQESHTFPHELEYFLSGNLNLYDVLAETHFAHRGSPTSSAQKATECRCTEYLNGLSPKW